MTNKEIKQAEKELSDIEKKVIPREGTLKIVKEPLEKFAEKYGIHQTIFYEAGIKDWTKYMFDHCHTFLQTKMMLNACVSAKNSCRWAAIAATLAFLSLPAFWLTVYLMLK